MKIVKSLIIIASLIVLIVFLLGRTLAGDEMSNGIIYASGGIEVTFTPDGWPFVKTNFLPGDVATKQVTVKNRSSRSQRVGVRIKSKPADGWLLPAALLLQIRDANTGAILLGGSQGQLLLLSYILPIEQPLFTLPVGGSRRLEVRVKFAESAGNSFQGKGTKFDFSLGFITFLPPLPLNLPPLPSLPPLKP